MPRPVGRGPLQKVLDKLFEDSNKAKEKEIDDEKLFDESIMESLDVEKDDENL